MDVRMKVSELIYTSHDTCIQQLHVQVPFLCAFCPTLKMYRMSL